MTSNVARIELNDFRRLITHLFTKWQRPTPGRIGLAISGGVDSMALAFLCSKVKSQGFFPDLKAFVVDHKIRPNSTEEAQLVQRRVERLGIETEILTAGDIDAQTHLEANARKARYKLLGKACHESNIQALFLGHHEDDQVETVFWRVWNSYARSGLAGMREISRIPECQGIYGVTSSGQPRRLRPENIWVTKNPNGRPTFSNMQMEGGGVDIFRPFLTCSKQQLIETCKSHNVEWVEDETNTDPTVCGRNVARYLSISGDLPQALQASRLLAMVRDKQAEETRLNSLTSRMLDDINIKLDMGFGRLLVKIPVALANTLRKRPDELKVRAHLLRTLIHMISPTDQMDRSQLHQVARDFLAADAGEMQQKTFNTAGYGGLTLVSQDDKFYTYKIVRRNPARLQSLSMSGFETSTDEAHVRWTPWQFFDNRYWIRLGHHVNVRGLPEGICVRHMSTEDTLNKTLAQRKIWRLITKGRHVDDNHRLSIPVISDASGKPLVAPTVHFNWDRSWHGKEVGKELSESHDFFYEVRYKG